MENKKIIFSQLPLGNIEDRNLARFLSILLEKLDIAFNNRGNTPLTKEKNFLSTANTLDGLREDFNNLKNYYILKSMENINNPLTYKDNIVPDNEKDLIDNQQLSTRFNKLKNIKKLDSNSTNNEIINKINEIIDRIDSF